MASLALNIGPLTATIPMSNEKAQEWARLLLAADPLPSSDAEGNPLSYTNQQKLDAALRVIAKLSRSVIIRQREHEMLLDYSDQIKVVTDEL